MIQVARATALLLAAFAVAIPVQAKECKEALKDAKAVKVRITTSQGPFVLELDREKAPVSTENFAAYVDSGHYNGTIFHRIIDGFMIQGGGFSKDGVQKPTRAPIKNESQNGLKNDPYTVAMARTQVRDSATSQFFINVENNDRLNYAGEMSPGYAVFGKVADGKDVVDKLRKVPVNRPGTLSEAQPVTPVVLEKAECL
jgi:cyclophilin family peptidyl-prolyl cis-trans isomerase